MAFLKKHLLFVGSEHVLMTSTLISTLARALAKLDTIPILSKISSLVLAIALHTPWASELEKELFELRVERLRTERKKIVKALEEKLAA